MSAQKIKVILVDDSAFMRILISEILRSDPDVEIIATAKDGKEGVAKAMELKPDVVVTDILMPEYDGIYLVKELMQRGATPIILLSSLDRTDGHIFEALQAGAFDFIDKPGEQQRKREADYNLLNLIKEAAKKKGSARNEIRKTSNSNAHTFSSQLLYDVVVIGASTGGPGAVEFILNNLPQNFAVPVVVAQHMPERFIVTFAERLNSKGVLKIKLAEKGETLKPGYVYLAPGDSNLRILRDNATREAIFTNTSQRYKEFNFPSVDCLFESAAETFGERVIAVILTGMGRDGTSGLEKINGRGGYTIAQDESTSVVFGMPKSANDAGAIRQILKLPEMPSFIVSCLS